MRIGLIGTGISGNLAARLLSQEHDIEVFEASSTVGGHTRTLDLTAFGQSWQVDTGFMVFNDRTYPNFCRLLQLLGLSGTDTDMSFSVTCARSGLEYQGSSLNGLFAQRRNLIQPRFWAMVRDILRFNRDAEELLASDLVEKTLRALLTETGYGVWFAEKYLVPMTAAIWSCPPASVWDFPAHFLLAFLRNHGLLQINNRPQWKTVAGSARSYVERLIAPLRDRIRTDCPVLTVQRHENHVVVHPRNAAPEVFNCVVLACHADQALALLQDADEEEREILEAFPYHSNTAVLHTDISILPRRRRAWASWNYHIPADQGKPVAVTYNLSRLQKLDTPTPLLLTLNAEERIDPAKVLNRHLFHHPGYTSRSLQAQERLQRRNGQRRTYYCGAYRGYGFHEDGVKSALDVTRHFGLGLDQWKAASTRASFTTSACSQ
ncbi:NAD(P)/FAD-dependent oxidoreductase [Tautonia sociabilis]|uniref:FAD-dependent oxidoreductase n=1 Tax=Tautonia sociabilis TaxID=2080755 RepID=A0A432MFA0_9BACT|nr:FAD-dependent oxidoreductase [Tautonia sociabilis]RUL84633.1 FAD-dependent oxidoreductase [Tautonia sociabilis]